MISTLSASRSNSLYASVQMSIVHSRDLRLSFPDPLTSLSPHIHSLRTSYEDISITVDLPAEPKFTADAEAQATAGAVAAATQAVVADVGRNETTLPVVMWEAAGMHTAVHSNEIVDFDIVLYGASSAIKHRVVHKLLEKLTLDVTRRIDDAAHDWEGAMPSCILRTVVATCSNNVCL